VGMLTDGRPNAAMVHNHHEGLPRFCYAKCHSEMYLKQA